MPGSPHLLWSLARLTPPSPGPTTHFFYVPALLLYTRYFTRFLDNLTGIMELPTNLLRVGLALLTIFTTALLSRILYMQKLHPLSKFPGPWYATSFSIVGAIISLKQKEPEFYMYLVRKYGSKCFGRALCMVLTLMQTGDRPIRVSPTLLLFPRPSALRDIYWDPRCNQKSTLYGTGAYVFISPQHS
jgi:hypothetical protein